MAASGRGSRLTPGLGARLGPREEEKGRLWWTSGLAWAQIRLVEAGWGWCMLSMGWGGRGFLLASLSVQDSDGDKSDDLVVDVSNEVRAGPDCRAALGLGGRECSCRGSLCVSASVLTYWQPWSARRPLQLGNQAGGEEQSRALLYGGWAFMGTAGFPGQVLTGNRPPPHPPKIPN